MKASKSKNRFETTETCLPKEPVLTSLILCDA